tara:strand:+ start:1102 stop:1869 length:768 start_codon:yes stop_codon:yes gene_type:complete
MEKELRAYIIDDEEAPRKLLRYLINRHLPEIKIVGESNLLRRGVEEIMELSIDILFLDIEMPEHKGTEILNFISTPVNFEIIFVTAYNDYAIDAFKLSAFDYLLKPLQPDELKNSIERLRDKLAIRSGHDEGQIELLDQNLNSTKRTYCLRTHREEYVIPLEDILYLEADGMYTSIYLKDNEITASKPLKEILSDLPDQFIRTHRSFAVNMKNIKSPLKFSGNAIELLGDRAVPVSTRKRSELMDSFRSFVSKED